MNHFVLSISDFFHMDRYGIFNTIQIILHSIPDLAKNRSLHFNNAKFIDQVLSECILDKRNLLLLMNKAFLHMLLLKIFFPNKQALKCHSLELSYNNRVIIHLFIYKRNTLLKISKIF